MRRLISAITCAKKMLIIIGNEKSFVNNKYWGKMIEIVREENWLYDIEMFEESDLQMFMNEFQG